MTDKKDVELIKKTLRDAMSEKDTPTAAKVSAARTMADLLGMGGRHTKPLDLNKPVNEMTADELEREIAAIQAQHSQP